MIVQNCFQCGSNSYQKYYLILFHSPGFKVDPSNPESKDYQFVKWICRTKVASTDASIFDCHFVHNIIYVYNILKLFSL